MKIEFDFDTTDIEKKIEDTAYKEVMETLTAKAMTALKSYDHKWRGNPESGMKDLVKMITKEIIQDEVEKYIGLKDEIIEKTASKLSQRLAMTKAAKELKEEA